jgi:hypothetical protein
MKIAISTRYKSFYLVKIAYFLGYFGLLNKSTLRKILKKNLIIKIRHYEN